MNTSPAKATTRPMTRPPLKRFRERQVEAVAQRNLLAHFAKAPDPRVFAPFDPQIFQQCFRR